MIPNTTNGSFRPLGRFPQGLCLLGGLAAAMAATVPTGCQSPYQRDAAEDLRRSVRAAVDREVADLPATGTEQTTAKTAMPLPPEFDARLEELDELGPRWVDRDLGLDLGDGLDGDALTPVSISLEDAVRSAVLNNLGIQRTRIGQAISAAEVVRAEAVFDAVLGAGASFARLDEPQPTILVPVQGSSDPIPLVQNRNISQWGFTTDLQKPLTSGGVIDLGFSGDRQRNFLSANRIDPDPAYQSAVDLGISQPLLQGFGEDVNTAGIQLARNADRRAAVELRQRLLSLVVAVEQAYWNVVYTRQDLEVARWLVAEGERIRDILANRRGFDTTLAQYADAVATVESRKTRLIRARRDIGRASDALKALLNDPALPVGGEFDLIPSDFMIDAPYSFDLRDSITTALTESPLIDAAILDIDDASINEIVARNGRLPSLDLRAEMAWLGLAGDYGSSVRNIDGDFINYLVGLQFSQPIGNRAADSVLRQARLQRSGAVIGYRQAVQDVVLEVKNAIRDIDAGYALIGQARNFRLAQAENLRALEAFRETLAALTPEFLNLLFQRQERLGEAQLQETNALVAYNIAIAQLNEAVGTGLRTNGVDLVVVDADGSELVEEQGP
ncbi:MAG: hypothetical protein CMJ34_08945 [Phycisphaerae bacterium]|nr:hypothetical protein [Phycisphaerae bacterium]